MNSYFFLIIDCIKWLMKDLKKGNKLIPFVSILNPPSIILIIKYGRHNFQGKFIGPYILPGSLPSPCAGGSSLPDWALSFEWPPALPRSPAPPKLRKPFGVREGTTRDRQVGRGGGTRSASGIGRNPRSRTKRGPIKFER